MKEIFRVIIKSTLSDEKYSFISKEWILDKLKCGLKKETEDFLKSNLRKNGEYEVYAIRIATTTEKYEDDVTNHLLFTVKEEGDFISTFPENFIQTHET